MPEGDNDTGQIKLQAEKVRRACLEAAREGFREAAMDGLCSEGAMEAAVGAIESLDLDAIIKQGQTEQKSN
ncbi:MAG: acetyltransferase [Balneolales bacterium]